MASRVSPVDSSSRRAASVRTRSTNRLGVSPTSAAKTRAKWRSDMAAAAASAATRWSSPGSASTRDWAARIGERVAAPGVTVFDDGALSGRRGSLTIDDEGTPTERTILIEDGILVGYMHDRMSARLTGQQPTGNGRRQSYAHMPMPRMTNTGMMNGDTPREEMIASMKRGLYCANFGGGQVDITNGKFVFQCTEAYLVENGKITAPVKGATLIGDGPSALTRVAMIGDDFAFDPGVGVCGKGGQSVPVGVGQPSLKITGLTVGGTSV